MKTLFASPNKRFTITETDGKVDFNVDGSPVDEVNGEGLLALGEAVIVHALPASMQPLGTVISGVVTQAVKALE